MAIWPMRIGCCVPRATNTHSSCVIHIAFPLQEWFDERASMLSYTYIDCLVSDEMIRHGILVLIDPLTRGTKD